MDAIPEFTRNLLVSLHPRHASNILAGEKTVELRRRFPEQHTRGALALIYSTAPVQAIVGVARIKHVLKLPISRIWKEYGVAACVSKAEVEAYFSGLREGYVILLEEARPLKRHANDAKTCTAGSALFPRNLIGTLLMIVLRC